MNHKPNKVAENFFSLAKLALVPSKQTLLAIPATEEQEIAFHKMHQRFIQMAIRGNKPPKFHNQIHERYPFLKVGDEWRVSVPKLYLYLISVRWAMGQFRDETIRSVYDAVQAAQKYYDEYTALDHLLTPIGATGYDDYTEKQKLLYENYMMVQQRIFGNVNQG